MIVKAGQADNKQMHHTRVFLRKITAIPGGARGCRDVVL